jgi:hypothetical protein
MNPLVVAGGIAAVLVLLGALGVVVVRKGRPFGSGDVFRASRWSKGNHLFPTQVRVSPTAVARYTPQWIGRQEESIHIAHVASVRINTKLLFADIFIETSGGVSPVNCYGHHKKDAVRIKELIDQYQSDYFKSPALSGPAQLAPERPTR